MLYLLLFPLALFSSSAFKSIQHNDRIIEAEERRLERDEKRLQEILDRCAKLR